MAGTATIYIFIVLYSRTLEQQRNPYYQHYSRTLSRFPAFFVSLHRFTTISDVPAR